MFSVPVRQCRIVQTDIKVNGVTRTYTTQLSYDSYGRLNTSTSPSGFATKMVYTSIGYLSQLQDNGTSASLVTINGLNAFGAVTQQTLGNGIVTDFGFDPKSGRLMSILSKKGTSTIQDLDYAWNTNTTMESRVAGPDIGIGTLREETMTYDALNRLEQATTELSGVWKRDLDTDYNNLGNITSHTSTKSGDDDVTAYGYGTDTDGNSSGTPGKHSVVSATINGVAYTMTYDENGAMDSIVQNGTTNGRYLQYNANNQPLFIVVGTSLLDLNPIAKDEFRYGPDGERYYRRSSYTEGGNAKTEEAFIVGGYEHTFITGDSVVRETKKSQAGSVLHVVATAPNNTVTPSIEYLLTDHLGSITRVTDDSGNLLVTQQFEPFGARKDSDWLQNTDATELSTLLAGLKVHTNRGYTGHEHLDRTGFIHMNGRLFEPTIARFMSPDPHVQAPGYSQNWNRLSYVLNSPLNFTDPSGLDISLFSDDYCAGSAHIGTYPTKEDAMDSRWYDFAESFWDTDDPNGDCNPIDWLSYWTIPGDEVTSWGTSTRTHVLGRNWNPQQGPLILWDPDPDMPFDMLPPAIAQRKPKCSISIERDTLRTEVSYWGGRRHDVNPGLANFLSGAGSYFEGLYGTVRFSARRSGLLGRSERHQTIVEGQIYLALLSESAANPGLALDIGKLYASENVLRVGGRSFVILGMAYGGYRTGPLGRASAGTLNAAALNGSIRNAIESGASTIEDLVRSVIGGEVCGGS